MMTRTHVGILFAATTLAFFAVDGAAQARLPMQGMGAGKLPTQVIDVAKGRVDFFNANPGANFFERGERITRVYGQAFSHGKSPDQSASAFIRDHADALGVRSNDLLPFGAFPDAIHSVDVYWDEATESFRFTLLGYSQVVEGIPVFRSALKLLMRNEPGFPLVLASSELRNLGAFPATLAARPTLGSFDRAVWSSQAIRIAAIAEPTDSQLVIFAGVDDSPSTPTLAVSFIVERGVPGMGYSKMLYVAEATTGKILFEEDQICTLDITGTVKGYATVGWVADACGNEFPAGLPYAAVSDGTTTTYADVNGAFVVANAGTGSLTLTSNMFVGGKYFKVDDIAATESTLSQNVASGGTAAFVHNSANTSEFERAEVNAYIHANVVRDFTLAANPNYPVIAGQQGATALQINTGVAGTCNAFYNGPSINFYSFGGGCNNTAFSTVVHHEFGHHVVASGGSGQGAYGEGMGDVMGALISESSALGVGFQSCATGIRNALNNCIFDLAGCSTCGSEIHACGQLISGCVWSTRYNLQVSDPATYKTLIRNWAVNAVLLHTGTTIAGDITIDYLTLDDDNGNINDGTPHFSQINDGFTLHGLPGPAVVPLNISTPNGIPTFATPNANLPVVVQVSALSGQPQPNTGKLYWRTGTSAFQSVAMTQTSTNVYTAQVPMSACGTPVNYYFEAKTTTNVIVTSPANAPTSFNTTTGAYGESTVISDTFESAGSWTVGATGDLATTGIWTRVDPVGTLAQPEDDHTVPGTLCYVTGQGLVGGALGDNDIDGGATTLTSPTFSALGLADPQVKYWRWYSNDKGGAPNADSMPIDISNNNGTTWVSLELVTENANAWVFKSFRISNFLTPTATMKVRFVASDLATGSVVEAGLDDFQVSALSCTPPFVPADLNQDTLVNGTDLAILLSGWGTLGGDINHDGFTDGGDLTLLLAAWTG
ncbi:MAG: hypothetical protein WCL33_03230 [Planctomycetota bacterium]